MRFLTDVDEVLADFVGPAAEVIRRVVGPHWTFADAPQDSWDMFGNLTADEMKVVDAIINAPGYCAGLKVHKGAQAFVKRLHELCDEVFACTSHMHSPAWVFERDNWLGEHFEIDRDHVIHTSAKYVCEGDFFLDDKPSHVIAWQAEHPNGVGMLWTTEHNTRLKGHDAIRVYSFAEVIERVEMRIRCTPTKT